MPLPAAPPTSPGTIPPWRRQARVLTRTLDVLAALYAVLMLVGLGLAVIHVIEHGRVPWTIQAHLSHVARAESLAALPPEIRDGPSSFTAATGMPEPLRDRAEWGHNEVELHVRPQENFRYIVLWLARLAVVLALMFVTYRALRALSTGFASGVAFSDAGAQGTRRLGSYGMAGVVLIVVLNTLIDMRAQAFVRGLATEVRDLSTAPFEVDISLLLSFPLFFFFWLLGGAMHRATIYESDARDTI